MSNVELKRSSFNSASTSSINDVSSIEYEYFERDFENKTEKGAFIRIKLLHNGILLTMIKNDQLGAERFITSNEIIACELVDIMQERKSVRQIACSSICNKGQRSGEQNNAVISCSSVELVIYAYVLQVKKQQSFREKLEIELQFDDHKSILENRNEAEKWEKAVLKIISKTTQARKEAKFLVFINPKSGSGRAKSTFDEKVSNILKLASVNYTVVTTTRPQFAHDYVRNHNLSEWTGIIICGGDGLLYEIINGIAARSDRQKLLENLTFGIIPCGSGNGLAATILNNYGGIINDNDSVLDMTLAAVCGRTSQMDLVFVETSSKRSSYSFLSLTWGFMADVDIKSEVIKPFVGNVRFTIWAIKNLLFLKRHQATLCYLPYMETADYDAEKIPPLNVSIENCSNWVTVEDSFVLITAAFKSHLSPDVFFAPQATLGDGVIWLIYVRATVSRYKLFNFLIGLSNGSHLPNKDDEDIKLVKCRAFRIVPKSDSVENGAVMAVDGEEFKFEAVQGKVLPIAAKVYVPNT